jgi:16S rRNA U516 pseudouridylate synthase RsuA-like enzyme
MQQRIQKILSTYGVTSRRRAEEFILNGCFDDLKCSEKKHRENRRLELIFVLD